MKAQTYHLAADVETEVEVARSGRFTDMSGTVVEVTPALMKKLVDGFDLETHEPKLKLGHEPIKTDTPDLGSVIGLRYDEAKDRLMAKIKPTISLVRKIREGAYNARSMEFSNGPTPRFLHLGFLGARRPAIGGLAPVAFAGPEGIHVLATDAEDESPAWNGPSEAIGAEYETAMLETHGNGIARDLIEQAGVSVAPGVEIDSASAARFLAAKREIRRAAGEGRTISFAEAVRVAAVRELAGR